MCVRIGVGECALKSMYERLYVREDSMCENECVCTVFSSFGW